MVKIKELLNGQEIRPEIIKPEKIPKEKNRESIAVGSFYLKKFRIC